MDRSVAVLLAVFAGVEPIVAGLITSQQWLVFLGLLNLIVVVLWYATNIPTKNPIMPGTPLKATHAPSKHESTLTAWHDSWHTTTHAWPVSRPKRATYFGVITVISLIGGLFAALLNHSSDLIKLAGWLITTGVIYWVLSSLMHGVGTTRKKWLSKLFGLLIIAWLGRGYVGGQNAASTGNLFEHIFSGIFSVPTVMAPAVPTPSIPTASIITGNDITKDMPAVTTWITTTGTTTTSATVIPTEPTSPAATGTVVTTPTAPGEPLTYATVVPAIVTALKMPVPNGSITFANIASTSPIYNAFKAGYAAKFFGAGINPQSLVPCNVYFVMLGLAQKWDVDYNSNTIFTAYGAEAAKRGQTYGCVGGKYVTSANLPK